MLIPENIDAMSWAIRNMKKGSPIVEIGSFAGLSTTVMAYLRDKYSPASKIYSCDRWQFEGQKPGRKLAESKTVTHDDYKAYVKKVFSLTAKTFAPHKLPKTIDSLSAEFFKKWGQNKIVTSVFHERVKLGGPIGFCYIDGNHTLQGVKGDFESVDPFVAVNGFILFDDSADGGAWQEVNQLARSIASNPARYKYTLVFKNPNYLFQKTAS